MQYTATIDYLDHVDAQRAIGIGTRTKIALYGLFYLGVAALITNALVGMISTATQVWQQGRASEVAEILDGVGKGHLPWLGALLIPVGMYTIARCAQLAYHLIVPLSWQPGARHRLKRKGYLGPHVYAFMPNQIVVSDRDGKVDRFDWANYKGFTETERGFYLICAKSGAAAFVLPKSGCRAPADATRLRNEISRHLIPV